MDAGSSQAGSGEQRVIVDQSNVVSHTLGGTLFTGHSQSHIFSICSLSVPWRPFQEDTVPVIWGSATKQIATFADWAQEPAS